MKIFNFLCIFSILAVSISGCGGSQPTPTAIVYLTPTPPHVHPASWQGKVVKSLCLEVSQKYIPNFDDYSLPLYESISVTLTRLGIRIVEPGQSCDATLIIELEGHVHQGRYERSGISKTCYSGVEMKGQMVFSSPGQIPISSPLDLDRPPMQSISVDDCGASDALDEALWFYQDLILRGLTSFWGPRVIVFALHDTEWFQRRASAIFRDDNLLQRATGSDRPDDVRADLVPDLTSVLIHSNDSETKFKALGLLTWMGSKAIQAVPAIIYLLEQDEYSASEYTIVNSLKTITGEDFGNNARRWRSWWESQ